MAEARLSTDRRSMLISCGACALDIVVVLELGASEQFDVAPEFEDDVVELSDSEDDDNERCLSLDPWDDPDSAMWTLEFSGKK